MCITFDFVLQSMAVYFFSTSYTFKRATLLYIFHNLNLGNCSNGFYGMKLCMQRGDKSIYLGIISIKIYQKKSNKGHPGTNHILY